MPSVYLEDAVRDQAREILGLGSFDPYSERATSDTGQITTFNQLGLTGVPDKPDGWYFPHNVATPALILETKSSDKDLDKQQFVDELVKNLRIVETKYSKAVGILYNGETTRAFLMRGGEIEERETTSVLQAKEFYLSMFAEDKIDKERIYQLTAKINNLLHFEFGIKNLNHRMIFTACALVARRYGLKLTSEYGYSMFHHSIKDTLNKELYRARAQNEKLDVLTEVYSEIKLNLNVEDEFGKNGERVRALLDQFIEAVNEISEAVNSDLWRGEDVMGIFFNEFNRYKGKSEAGQVFTPDHITGFMYKLIGVNQNDRVLDACCGSGAFLVKSMGNMVDEAGGRGTEKAAFR